MIVLDSTVLIDFLRGRPVVERVLALRESGTAPATTAINVEEITRGVRPPEIAAVDRLISGLVILPIDRAAGELAGGWRREHSRRGVTVAQADGLIAAATVGHRATLATGNPKDFPMPGLRVEHWPVGA